jgi:hypothetical protein
MPMNGARQHGYPYGGCGSALDDRAICPVGEIPPCDARPMSTPTAKNISLRHLLDTALLIPAIPPHQEGRIAIVTNVGAGCGGRLWREDEGAHQADGEVVWF